MPSTLFRTASSTVVLLTDDRLLEVRRGDLRGKDIPDKRTWDSQEEWLAAIGEPLIPDVPLSDDIKLVASLYRKYQPHGSAGIRMTYKGQSSEHHKLTNEAIDVSKALKRVENIARGSDGKYRIPNAYRDLVDGKRSENPYVSTLVSAEEYERYRNGLHTLLSSIRTKLAELHAKLKTDLAAGRFQGYFTPFGKSSIYVGCADGTIRPIYYNVTYNVCCVCNKNVAGSVEIRTGRSFEELGIRPVSWYFTDFMTHNMLRIMDFP